MMAMVEALRPILAESAILPVVVAWAAPMAAMFHASRDLVFHKISNAPELLVGSKGVGGRRRT